MKHGLHRKGLRKHFERSADFFRTSLWTSAPPEENAFMAGPGSLFSSMSTIRGMVEFQDVKAAFSPVNAGLSARLKMLQVFQRLRRGVDTH